MFGLTALQVGIAFAFRHSDSGDEIFEEKGGENYDSEGYVRQ